MSQQVFLAFLSTPLFPICIICVRFWYNTLMSETNLTFHLPAPDVHPQRCIHARHRQAGCRLCTDHCPVEAIHLAEGPLPLPLLDIETCVGCGVCLPVCPTDAFTQTPAPEARWVGFADDELPPQQAFALTCPQHPSPEFPSAPADYVILHHRCLAAFSPENLLTLSGDGIRHIWLEDTPCGTCPLSLAHETIRAHVHAANQLLMAFGLPAAVHLSTDVTIPEEHSPKPVLDSTSPAVDRRGFFRSLGRWTRQRLEETRAQGSQPPMIDPGAPVDQRLPYHVPPSHEKLNRHLLHLAQAASPQPSFILDAPALPWSDLELDVGACSGCQLCSRFCPTGALNYLWAEFEEGPAFNLTFHPRLCIDCNICVAVCPDNALELTHAVSIDKLLHPERQLLLADYLVPCQACGTLTRLREGEGKDLCYVCREPSMFRQQTQRDYLAELASRLREED